MIISAMIFASSEKSEKAKYMTHVVQSLVLCARLNFLVECVSNINQITLIWVLSYTAIRFLVFHGDSIELEPGDQINYVQSTWRTTNQ